MDYFDGLKSTDEIKNRYRELASQHHPKMLQDATADDTEAAKLKMQMINAEYALAMDLGVRREKPGATEEKYTEAADVAENIRQAIDRIMSLPGIQLEVCGYWVWVHGNTYPIRAELKEAGCSFLGKKKKWVFKGVATRSRGNWSMNDIRDRYGSHTIQREERV